MHKSFCDFASSIYLVKTPRSGIDAQKNTTYVNLLVIQIMKSDTNLHCLSHQKEANKTYNCENLGLREIPDTLPNTTEFLEFSFNFLPAIQNTTFCRLTNLIFLDLTRYVSASPVCTDVLLKEKHNLYSKCIQDLWGAGIISLSCVCTLFHEIVLQVKYNF